MRTEKPCHRRGLGAFLLCTRRAGISLVGLLARHCLVFSGTIKGNLMLCPSTTAVFKPRLEPELARGVVGGGKPTARSPSHMHAPYRHTSLPLACSLQTHLLL